MIGAPPRPQTNDAAELRRMIEEMQRKLDALPTRWQQQPLLHFVNVGGVNTIGTYGGIVIKGLKYSSTPISAVPTLTFTGTPPDGLAWGQLDDASTVWIASSITPPGGTTQTFLSGHFPQGSIVLVGAPIMLPVTDSEEFRPVYPIIKI